MEETVQQEYRSGFKPWIRAVALLLVVVFAPEQAAQAMGYDPTTIWNHAYFVHQGKNGFLTYLVADNIKRSLNSLAYKQLNQVQLANDLVIETKPLQSLPTRQGPASSQKTPLYLTGEVIKQINLWLKDPKTQVDNNCGINALYLLLEQSNIKVRDRKSVV